MQKMEKLKKIKIESSTIDNISYDKDAYILYVQFERGAIYKYYDVEYGIVLGMLFADSSGAYFTKHISIAYTYEKVSG